MPIRILHVVGARPNFMKVAPVMHAMAGDARFEQFLVHTGQHYDAELSDVFLDELDLPEPYANLGVGSGTHAKQVADVMTRLDDVLVTLAPDWVLVPGDVNSTLAAALVCSKLGVRVGHVEAGLRSHDRDMPEEINRLLTDQNLGIVVYSLGRWRRKPHPRRDRSRQNPSRRQRDDRFPRPPLA